MVIDYSQIANIENFLNDIPKDIQKTIDDTLLDSAEFLIEKIRELAPRSNRQEAIQHRHYADSWKIGERTKKSIQVFTPQGTLYLILEVQGRRPGRIYARRKLALRFWLDGELFFRTYVDHPGFPPMPHVLPAINQLKQKMPSIFLGHLRVNIPVFR